MGLGGIESDGDPAGVGVLDDGHGRLGEVMRRPPRRVGIDVVVVRHRLAVQLLRGGQARRLGLGHVEGGTLVGVLAVTQYLGALPDSADPSGEATLSTVGRDEAAHPGRDGDVIRRGVTEGLHR